MSDDESVAPPGKQREGPNVDASSVEMFFQYKIVPQIHTGHPGHHQLLTFPPWFKICTYELFLNIFLFTAITMKQK